MPEGASGELAGARGRGTRAASAGPSLSDPAFPGRRVAQSLSSPPKLQRLKESQQSTRACQKNKFTVIESQKTLAGKRRRVRRPHESLDARVAAVSSSLYVCCMTREGWIRTELSWTRTGLDGGQSSEGFGGGVGEGDYFSLDSIKPCGACRWTPSSTGS